MTGISSSFLPLLCFKNNCLFSSRTPLTDAPVLKVYPNPYNLSFNINFYLSRSSKVKIELFNLLGKKVKEIENKNIGIGNHQYLINTPELSSGVYFLKAEINKEFFSKRILLIK